MYFWIGALGYPALEWCWRGRTHPSMVLAGGLSMLWLGRVHHMGKGRPVWQLALLGGLGITGIEYAAGRIFNRSYRVWDYRDTPLNLHGQICLPYALAWCGLSAAALAVMRRRASNAPASAASGGGAHRPPWKKET